MKPATVVSIACVAVACWMASASPAEACSCSPPETRVAFERSVAVFEGTVVDERVTLVFDGPYLVPAPRQQIVVGRVWKGVTTSEVSVLYLNGGMCSGSAPVGMTVLFFFVHERGRLAYGGCMPNWPITGAADAVATLGPPIATFADLSPGPLTVPAPPPLSYRVRAAAATAAARSFNAVVDLLAWR